MRALAALGLILVLAGCGRMLPDPQPYGPYGPTAPTPSGAPPASISEVLIDQPLDGRTRDAVLGEGAALGRCLAQLSAAEVRFSPRPDEARGGACGLYDAGTLGADMGTVARMTPGDPVVTCQTALAISIWRRQSVEPAAREIFGQDVVSIDHFGTYACRPVNNVAGNRPSAHGLAAALDFSGVRLRDGRRITVSGDWSGNGPEARFLRRIRDDACRIFGTTLSPDYNAVHADHLHLEATETRFCR